MNENLKNHSWAERVDILSANAVKKEKFGYFKPLTEDQLAPFKDEYFKAQARIDGEKENLDAAKEAFKIATAEPMANLKENYAVIKAKGQQVEEYVYLVPDQGQGIMEYINDAGEVVFSRRLNASEKQTMLKVSNDE